MPGSSHHGLTPRASNTNRGSHPDIDPASGQVRWEAIRWPDPEERDFNIRMRDPGFAQNYLQRVAARQSMEPSFVQSQVAGQEFGAGQGAYRGVVEYRQELDRLRAIEDDYEHPNATVVRDYEIPDMPMERFEQLFDERGQPRAGVVLEHTNRSIRLDDQIDRASMRENFSNR
jgi:hypothetical protein